jgi:hypothetical protein
MSVSSPRRTWIPSPRVALVLSLALATFAGKACLYRYANRRRAAFAYVERVMGGTIGSTAPEWVTDRVKSSRLLYSVEYIEPHDRAACDLANVAALSEARDVDLRRSDIDDQGFAAIRQFRRLKQLGISHTKITDNGLAALRYCRALEVFSCNGTTITDAGLSHLAGLPIRDLSLGRTAVTGDGLRYLEAAPLTELWLAESEATDAGLANVSRLKSLRILNISSTRITDAALAHLADLQLDELNLMNTRVTDAGVARLDRLPLMYINLIGTDVTREALPTLRRMTRLKYLLLSNPPFTEADVRLFRAAGVEVHLRGDDDWIHVPAQK